MLHPEGSSLCLTLTDASEPKKLFTLVFFLAQSNLINLKT